MADSCDARRYRGYLQSPPPVIFPWLNATCGTGCIRTPLPLLAGVLVGAPSDGKTRLEGKKFRMLPTKSHNYLYCCYIIHI